MKASAGQMIPQTSRVDEISSLPSYVQPVTLDIGGDRPIGTIDDPKEIIPHDRIPITLRSTLISMMGEELFLKTEWSRLRLTKLARAISHPRENVINSLAQICSPGCPFVADCPYELAGVIPAGERCPVEMRNARLLLKGYMEALSDRLGAEISDLENDMITYNLVMGVVEADIVSNRLNSILAKDGPIQEDPAAIHQESGRVWYKDEESVVMKMKDRVNKRKDSLFEQLIATPEMQAKYRRSKGDSAAALLSDLISSLTEKIDNIPGNIIDAEVVDE